ncbi:MAG: hypothetical protein ACI4MJ_00705 [Aristaeellaceae bacterium]
MGDMLKTAQQLLPSLGDYLVYAAIAIVTLIGVVKCLVPLWNTTHALRRAVRRLQQDAGNTSREKPVWQESRFMGRRLRGSWLRFLQNAEQLDRRGLPCAVEDYINDDTVTHGPGNAQLAELIPNLLTSLGILGTFMGMMRGLGGLDFSDSANIIAGIPKLLSGMQFAFGTSVAGISCSLVFNMLNRIAQGSSYRAVDDFVESFTQLAMQRPLDNDVQLICQNQDANHMLSTLTDVLPQQIAGSIELSLSRTMQPVAKSMDNFLIGATRAQVEGVGRIVNNFVQNMNDALGHQLLSLGQTLTDINQHQRVTMEQVEQTLHSAAAIAQDVGRLQGVSQDVMTHFEHYIQELSEARRRDEGFEQASSELLHTLQQAVSRQQEALAALRGYQDELSRAQSVFAQQSREAVSSLKQASTDNAGHLAQMGKAMESSSEQLSRSYGSFVENVVEGLSRSLGMFEQSMNNMVSVLGERISTLDRQGGSGMTATQASEIQRLLASMEQTLRQAAGDDIREEG